MASPSLWSSVWRLCSTLQEPDLREMITSAAAAGVEAAAGVSTAATDWGRDDGGCSFSSAPRKNGERGSSSSSMNFTTSSSPSRVLP